MPKSRADKSKVRASKKVSFAYLHKLTCAVSLLAFVVVIAAGVIGEARTITITYRAAGVIILIGLVSRIVMRVLASYEEINSGKA